MDEGSARRRDLCLTTYNIHKETDIHSSGGNQTRKLSKRLAADPRLRPLGHWDRRQTKFTNIKPHDIAHLFYYLRPCCSSTCIR
jgi:hypothetical protein